MFPDVRGKLREEIPNCAGGHSSFVPSRFILAWGMWIDHWIMTTDKRRINEMTVGCTTDLRGSACLHLYKEPKGQVYLYHVEDKKTCMVCPRKPRLVQSSFFQISCPYGHHAKREADSGGIKSYYAMLRAVAAWSAASRFHVHNGQVKENNQRSSYSFYTTGMSTENLDKPEN